VNSAAANDIVAGAGITGTVTVNGMKAGSSIDAENASTVAAVASTAAGTHSASVTAANATTVTVTNFADATVVAPKATAITVDDNGKSTGTTHVTIDAASVTFTNTNAVGTVTVATEGDDATAATINAIGKALVIEGEGDFTLNSTATAEVITNSKTSGTLTVKNTTTTALDLDEVSADTIWLTGVKTAADTVASGANLKYSGAATDVAVTVAGAGTADTATATVTSATVTDMILSGVETLNVVAAAPSVSGADLTVTTLDTNGNKVVLSGSNDVTFTTIDHSGGTGSSAGTVDASALTGGLTVSGTQADENLTLLAGSGTNAITLSGTTSTQSYTGGNGKDTVTDSVTTGSKTHIMADGVNASTAAALTTGTLVYSGGAGVDTVTIGGSGVITTANVNVSAGGGNDVVTITADAGTLAAATFTVNGGAGDDTITFTGDNAMMDTVAGTTITIDGGDGEDILSLGDLAGNDDVNWSAGTISISNIEVIQLNANAGDNSNATFQAADISGQSITMKADGAGDGFTVVGATTTTSIDLSTLTIDQTLTKAVVSTAIDGSNATAAQTIIGTSVADTITGSGVADTITGGNGIDTITAGAGNDTIILTEATANQVADEIVLTGRATNGKDTIKGFKVGTDNINLVNAEDTTTEASISIEAVTTSLVTGAAAYAFTGTTMDTTSGANIAEIVVTLTSNGDLDTATDGTELLKALSTSATAAATSITLDTSASGYMIAYQDGNAYMYAVDAGTNATLAASEMTLVAVLEDITAGALTAGDFVV
jgi:S-layer protein